MSETEAGPSVLDYDNRTGRPTGRTIRALGVVLPGVTRVQAQVPVYAAQWRAHNAAWLGSPLRRWVVLGDSMSQGIGASSYDAGWVGQLRARVDPDGDELALVNLSASGARLRDVLDVQLPLLESLPSSSTAPLVTVLIGSNDLFAGGAVRRALGAAMAELVERLPDGSVVATLPQPREAAREANRHLDGAEATGHLHLVDLRVSGPSSWRGKLAADMFHPNDAGYTSLADAFEPVVRRVLAREA